MLQRMKPKNEYLVEAQIDKRDPEFARRLDLYGRKGLEKRREFRI